MSSSSGAIQSTYFSIKEKFQSSIERDKAQAAKYLSEHENERKKIRDEHLVIIEYVEEYFEQIKNEINQDKGLAKIDVFAIGDTLQLQLHFALARERPTDFLTHGVPGSICANCEKHGISVIFDPVVNPARGSSSLYAHYENAETIKTHLRTQMEAVLIEVMQKDFEIKSREKKR